MAIEEVTLVDCSDRTVGAGEKMRVHRRGQLHRAFSIFAFNAGNELLLQKRAAVKYHSAGLWSNTCCGHPRPGETVLAAARRRLREEMGFCCALREIFRFNYRARLDNNLIENEWDHVLFGEFNAQPLPNPSEVEAWCWIRLDRLQAQIRQQPQAFTLWLRLAVESADWTTAIETLAWRTAKSYSSR